MSTPENRRPAAPGQVDAAAVIAQMQAAIAEVGRQRDEAQARAVELAVTLATTKVRLAAVENELDSARRMAAPREGAGAAPEAQAKAVPKGESQ